MAGEGKTKSLGTLMGLDPNGGRFFREARSDGFVSDRISQLLDCLDLPTTFYTLNMT